MKETLKIWLSGIVWGSRDGEVWGGDGSECVSGRESGGRYACTNRDKQRDGISMQTLDCGLCDVWTCFAERDGHGTVSFSNRLPNAPSTRHVATAPAPLPPPPMAPKCEPLCHFGDRHVLPAHRSPPLTVPTGSTLPPSPIPHPAHTSSTIRLPTHPAPPACARDHEEAHPHPPTTTPPTTTSRSMTSCSISPSSRTGAPSISPWSTRRAS